MLVHDDITLGLRANAAMKEIDGRIPPTILNSLSTQEEETLGSRS